MHKEKLSLAFLVTKEILSFFFCIIFYHIFSGTFSQKIGHSSFYKQMATVVLQNGQPVPIPLQKITLFFGGKIQTRKGGLPAETSENAKQY